MDMNNLIKRDRLIEIAQSACEVILKEKRDGLRIYTKRDHSVVTSADHASEHVIVNALRTLDPDTPVVSEEEHADGKHVAWSNNVWLVDPLDSTSGFARGSPDYAVCMAEIVNNQPEWGVVAVPETGEIYVGQVSEGKVWKVIGDQIQQLPPVHAHKTPLHCVLSPTDTHAHHACKRSRVSFRGSALKFGLVAEGAADVYVRSGSLMHWDIAAGDAIVRAAGGACVSHAGHAFTYMPHAAYMPPFVVRSRAVQSHQPIML
jgi:3'(2'), 5'-bisphosphate nucleotidase